MRLLAQSHSASWTQRSGRLRFLSVTTLWVYVSGLRAYQRLCLREQNCSSETKQSVPHSLSSVGITPQSLASGCDSWRSFFEAWKTGVSNSSIAELGTYEDIAGYCHNWIRFAEYDDGDTFPAGTIADSPKYEKAPGLIEAEGEWWSGLADCPQRRVVGARCVVHLLSCPKISLRCVNIVMCQFGRHCGHGNRCGRGTQLGMDGAGRRSRPLGDCFENTQWWSRPGSPLPPPPHCSSRNDDCDSRNRPSRWIL